MAKFFYLQGRNDLIRNVRNSLWPNESSQGSSQGS